MKTKIQFPNGLTITVEYDATELNQLPEVDKFTAEAISYQHRDLLDEVEALKKLIDIYHKDLKELSIMVREQPAPASEKQYVHNITFSTEHPKKKEEKPAPKWSKKPCSKCGELFQPTGPRSTLCESCKAEKQNEPAE